MNNVLIVYEVTGESTALFYMEDVDDGMLDEVLNIDGMFLNSDDFDERQQSTFDYLLDFIYNEDIRQIETDTGFTPKSYPTKVIHIGESI
jgi:hypothetical protein